MEDKHADRRKELFQLSLKEANTPKFGYFGYTAPLAVGDNSLAPRTQLRTKFNRPNVLMNPPKAGVTTDSFFSVTTPLCINDPYIDPAKRTRRKRQSLAEGTPEFRSSGVVIRSSNKLGYLYETHGSAPAKPKRKDIEPRNFLCNPSRKGSCGALVSGAMFGFGDERRTIPDHVPDDFNVLAKIAKSERLKGKAKMPEMPFKGSGCLKLGI
eukprot:GEMP01050610.1.p1 GENE.GEMP01050610.1~~GEMP01050610.1.p1  ORF type:complete len:211 (+),score=26.02 GEMP01050610.1:70-702(+)